MAEFIKRVGEPANAQERGKSVLDELSAEDAARIASAEVKPVAKRPKKGADAGALALAKPSAKKRKVQALGVPSPAKSPNFVSPSKASPSRMDATIAWLQAGPRAESGELARAEERVRGITGHDVFLLDEWKSGADLAGSEARYGALQLHIRATYEEAARRLRQGAATALRLLE